MAISNINVRVDKSVKEQAEHVFDALGINMSTAINMYLRATIRENGLPFNLKLDTLNQQTISAIEEGRRIAKDPSVKGFQSIDELRNALDV